MSPEATLPVEHPADNTSDLLARLRRSPPRQIAGLDLLRFLAALLVTLHHLAFWIWAGPHFNANYHYLGPYTWNGWVGVEIFFVISGFIIPYSARRASLQSFAVSRAIRLYPAVWVCATITFLFIVLSHSPSDTRPVTAWINSLVLDPRAPWIDGVYWTLAVELSFYVLIALLLTFRRFRNIGLLMGVLGWLSAGKWLLSLAMLQGLRLPHTLEHGITSFDHTIWGTRLLIVHGCFFSIGTYLWLSLFDRITFWRMLSLLVFTTAGCIEILERSSVFLVHLPAAEYPIVAPLILWLAFLVALILATVYNHRLASLLGHRGSVFARRLGLVTYPLYLLHQQIGYILIPVFHRYMPDVAALGVTLTGVLAASFLINAFAEQPIQAKLKTWLVHRPLPAPPATTLP